MGEGKPIHFDWTIRVRDEGVMKFALNRNAAKKPVMTIGYGSEKFAIVPTFLTHNGQKGGIHEWAMFRTSDKSELTKEEESELKSKYPEDSDKKERDKIAKSRMIAHPNSVLGNIQDKISREQPLPCCEYYCRFLHQGDR